MADETCVEVNCCPLGYSVPSLGGTLALIGDDSTGTDPRIVAGDYIWGEEAVLTTATLTNANNSIVVASANNIQIGYAVECIGVYKTVQATLGSANVTVPNTAGLKIGQLMEAPLEYFPYSSLITNISGLTVTLSNPAIATFSFNVLFRPLAPPLIVGSSVVIPSTLYPSFSAPTTVTSLAGNTLGLSVPPTASMTLALLSFFPADVDPNVNDEDRLFT